MNGIIVSTPTPYRMVASLPASATDGSIVFLTTDFLLYVWYSGAWHVQGGGASDPATFDFVDGTDFLFADGTGFDYVT